MAAGIGIAILSYVLTFTLIGVTAAALDRDLDFEDTPLFDAAGDLARYTDERLKAAAEGTELPAPPTFAGDLVTARIAYLLGAVNAVGITVAAFVGMGRWRKQFEQALGLGAYSFDRLWKPGLVTIAAYVIVILYSVTADALDLGILEPEQSVPGTIMRDDWGMAIFAVLAIVFAPLSEEIFFRGLVFGGFARWGFAIAGPLSAVIFAASHVDPGTLIPFTIVGLMFAWLYRSSGSLWDSIAAHAMFNSISTFLLLFTR
ncbi:MAG: CPBP family intramembrane metalloprotease [Dehalococcoidia bacterium]|nr:CPBP family intramembrane metalloprotease [Dehalococcoidia bacterium]